MVPEPTPIMSKLKSKRNKRAPRSVEDSTLSLSQHPFYSERRPPSPPRTCSKQPIAAYRQIGNQTQIIMPTVIFDLMIDSFRKQVFGTKGSPIPRPLYQQESSSGSDIDDCNEFTLLSSKAGPKALTETVIEQLACHMNFGLAC